VDKVVGSMDRYEDFDHTFLPKTPHTLERWKRLRAPQLSGVELPPIEVYQVGEAYFVKEAIRRLGLLRDFPGRTEADLYLWVMDHRHFLAQEGRELSPEEAARSYEERFGPLWKRLGGALKRLLAKS
jgi:hypothetical protein